MESLLEHLDRFSEVLAVSRTPHVSSWNPATVRRALQWARYLRGVHRRFGCHVRIRTALERRLQNPRQQEGGSGPAAVSGLTNFQDLGRCDILLSQHLLQNRALGDAAFHCLLQQLFPGPGVPDAEEGTLQNTLALLARRRSAVRLLLRVPGFGEKSALWGDSLVKTQAELLLERVQEAGKAHTGRPSTLLSSLWERLPHDNFLDVLAAALLLPSPPRPPKEQLELGSPETPGEGVHEVVHWLLGKSDVMATFCRNLPAATLTSVGGCHPELLQVYLGLLAGWGRQLHYDLQKGVWVGAEAGDVPWEELYCRFQSLSQAPSPLKDEVLRALESWKAQDGGFEVPGLSIWTDLLSALGIGV